MRLWVLDGTLASLAVDLDVAAALCAMVDKRSADVVC